MGRKRKVSNVRETGIIGRMNRSEGWIRNLFRDREFSMEWDGTIRGRGKTSVGVPQGSPSLICGIPNICCAYIGGNRVETDNRTPIG